MVNGARTRIAEYLLAAFAADDVPPTDDFMLITDPDDLNPAMIVRYEAYLDAGKPRFTRVVVVVAIRQVANRGVCPEVSDTLRRTRKKSRGTSPVGDRAALRGPADIPR